MGVLVRWLCWGLTSQSTIFQSYRDGAIASWVINQYFRGVKCLAQGHNTAAVGLEPRTSRSRVRHSTTEPPRSPWHGGRCPVVSIVYWGTIGTHMKRWHLTRFYTLSHLRRYLPSAFLTRVYRQLWHLRLHTGICNKCALPCSCLHQPLQLNVRSSLYADIKMKYDMKQIKQDFKNSKAAV